ncbi:hypothetical protein Poli38472_008584 [Pythium oligandrum]|uniref:CCT-theta n=1 Tax=Pythium oligandrum TaxID=41045 RepID=A0A8K1FBB4_PYTOL|nr:hypothetical protein Poli38472_008584 [Pythium oligandrum]|eukprot:TMW55936.1 hypothetical protein Poli38472_008584 [Pythium oligandrum]
MAKSMGLNVAGGLSSLLKDGHKHFEGVDEAVAKNIDAVKQLAAITRSSLGPNGMNKLVINHLEKIFVTSDTATIVNELEVVHPAAKMVAMAAKMQENDFGDGTCLVVSLAGELLMEAASLLRMGLHASEIVTGYEKAYEKCIEVLEGLESTAIENIRDQKELEKAIKTSLASKQFGYEDLLAQLVAEACLTVMPSAPKKPSINVDNIRVCKIRGGNLYDSSVIKGMVIQRDAEGGVKKALEAKVAVFGCGIEISSTEAKSTVLIKDADELMNYNKSEEKHLEEAIRGIAESGAKVVVSGGSISEMALHFLEKYKLMAVKITSKWELRRLCRAVNANALVRLGAPTPDEMGFCDSVTVKEIGGKKVIIFRQDQEDAKMSTIVLRASTDNVLNDIERAIDDGVNCVKATCKQGRFVAGAGATELELSRQIKNFGDATPGLDQYAIKKFGDALEIVPRILAENAGLMGTEVISSLYASHAAGNLNAGVEVEHETESHVVTNALSKGIWDHLQTKKSAIRLGADAAITVLRVDQIIMAKPAGGPKPRGM